MGAMAWDKWFWSDYDADEGLRMCSLAAQGLWMRMLCLMARATPKGELRVGSQPCTTADLSRVTGEHEETVAELLGELEKRGVFSRTRADVIYNRRLRKDAELSKKRAKAGAKGAYATNLKTKHNPDLPQQKAGKPLGKKPAPEARSQSSVTSVTDTGPPDPKKILFDMGKGMLVEAGCSSPESAGGIVAKWEKRFGCSAVTAELLACPRMPFKQMVARIEARLSEQAGTRGAYLGQLERKYGT